MRHEEDGIRAGGCGEEPKGCDIAADAPYAFAFAQDAKIGVGGAPTRATCMPTDPAGRKTYPVASGCLDYFPDAIAEVSHLSHKGNEQHNPGQPLHWARGKSADEADTLMRHFLQRGTLDTDGIRHSVKVAWRALALLQKEIEAENGLRAKLFAEQNKQRDAEIDAKIRYAQERQEMERKVDPHGAGRLAPTYERTRMESQ
jgi:hypothetical protein